MTIEQLYRALGGDYRQACRRIPSALLERFLKRFLSDDSAGCLAVALADGDQEEAFRYALALKGVAGNLGIEDLAAAVDTLSRAIRVGQTDVICQAQAVEREYRRAVEAITRYFLDK